MEDNMINVTEKTPCPCKTCRRVSNSYACDNKECTRWQEWWIEQWERTRVLFRAAKDIQPAPAPANKLQYDTPDHVRRYLAEDPCTKCKIPKDLCSTPCRSKKNWEDAKKGEL